MKRKALYLSFLLLFIPWGLEYEMVNDWETNLLRWQIVNGGASRISREIEPVYAYLMSCFSYLGFFGWLMISALFTLAVLYFYIQKYVDPKYYWVSFASLLLYSHNALLMINSNRQTIALVFILIGVLFLISNRDFTIHINNERSLSASIIKPCIFFVFYLLAINIHGGSSSAILLLLLYYVSSLIKNLDLKWSLSILLFLYSTRFFFDSSSLQTFALLQYEKTEFDHFDQYLEQISVSSSQSIVFNIISLYLLLLILKLYKLFDSNLRFFSLSVIFALIFKPFFIENLARIIQYYLIFGVVLIPQLFYYANRSESFFVRKILQPMGIIVLLLISYDFVKVVSSVELWSRWLDFTTVFNAPIWL